MVYPAIDLRISSLFYRKDGGFYLEFHPIIRAIYLWVTILTKALVFGLVVALLCSWRWTNWRASVLYLMVALAIGPGILTHYVMKDMIERPRPRAVVEFAGNQPFAPLFVRGTEEGKSFTSGHAAMGFYLAAFALLARGRRRVVLYGAAVLAGCFIGGIRVMQGGHFASDVVFSGILTLMVVHACYACLSRL